MFSSWDLVDVVAFFLFFFSFDGINGLFYTTLNAERRDRTRKQ